MPSRNGISAKRKITRRPGSIIQGLMVLIRFLVSPLVILTDSFRRKGNLDKTWLFSFFLLTTMIMGFTGAGILVTEAPIVKTLKMMTAITEDNEILAGNLQPMIRIINKYALQYNVDPNLVFAIIKAESNFVPTAVSHAGARGLMQIMPEVWTVYSDTPCNGRHPEKTICHPGNCIFDPEANIRTGVKYFREMLDTYHGRVDLALEAYNAGITNVRPGQAPKYKETRSYIDKIVIYWKNLRKEAIDQQLKLSLQLQQGLKWLFFFSFGCWLILFWWASRKLLSKA
ncbi:MAG: lytic transglycosylase domain-containing protein [Firmicutes bacterium]|nr:lytic transglycosylase domain-containing protein [Bacillota bacterium]